MALSRARLGLYILGRKAVFESCYELKEAFDRLFQRPHTLKLVASEMFPAERDLQADVDETEMVGIEHLGQYVYEMTQAKMKQLSGSGATYEALPDVAEEMEVEEDVERGEEDADSARDEDEVQPEELEI